MDEKSLVVTEFLDTLGKCNYMFSELSLKTRKNPSVLQVMRDLESQRKNNSGYLLEGYVDAFFTNGNSVCWYIEVDWSSENWLIESYILTNTDNGQEIIHRFTTRETNQYSELLIFLVEAVKELVDFDAVGLAVTKGLIS